MRFRQRRRHRDAIIDLTALIDVIFVLLLFFVLTTTFTKDSRLNLVLPQTEHAETAPQEQQVLLLGINSEGSYAINGKALVNDDSRTLRLAIEQFAEGRTDLPVSVQGDARAPHEAVVRALDVLGDLGFSRIGIAARRAETANP